MLRRLYHILVKKLRLGDGDLFIFLLSLAVAFGAWLVTNLSREYSCIVSVPVYAGSNLDGYSTRSSSVSEISARCRASGFHILRHSGEERPLEVFFQPSDLHRQGGGVFSITANELSGYAEQLFGSGVTLESFLSPEVEFTFAEENHKKVPVQPVRMITYKSQYMATGPLGLEPDSVTVYGEPLHLDNIDRVYTSAITLSNLKSPVRGVVKLDVPPDVRVSASEVTYSLDVTRYVEVRSTVKIGVRNVPSGRELSVFPSSAEVVYRCSFPLGVDPTQGVSFWIDYKDFVRTLSGRCIPSVSGLSRNIIDCRLEPEVFECVENVKR